MHPRKWLKPVGYLMQIVGGGGLIVLVIRRASLGLPYDTAHGAFNIANAGVLILGVCVVGIAKWLQELEGRLNKLDGITKQP